MVLARYRAAAALMGDPEAVLEVGCGEGIGAAILSRGRRYVGVDPDADAVAVASLTRGGGSFRAGTAADLPPDPRFEAAVSLDVIEHVPSGDEHTFLGDIARRLTPYGACVVGTPNATFEHLASPQSKAGHINLYTHDRLLALMTRHFRVIQSFGMQDTALHLGHPDARHYLMFCGVGPRTGRW